MTKFSEPLDSFLFGISNFGNSILFRLPAGRQEIRISCFEFQPLGGFGDQFGAKASRADLHSNHPSLFGRLHLMEVGIPNLLGLIIGVAHIVAKHRSFSTNITHSCHG